MADDEPLELLQLLSLPPGAPLVQRHRRWARAFETWLHARRTQHHPSLGRSSHQAWREFLDLTRKSPWQVTVADVDAYTASLEARGLRPSTIATRLAALSSFYAHCHEHRIDPRLRPGFNPVKAARRPNRAYYQKMPYLSPVEEADLLQAARWDDWPISKRDYALLLTLLRTGWKSSQVRTLTWGQLCALMEQGEGTAGVPPPAVYAAIRDYLHAAGRLEGIQPDHYVFAPVNQHVLSERRERAQDWDPARPLSAGRLQRVLKRHARLAGLKVEAVTCHTLRHTTAVRHLESGQSLDAVGKRLGRKGKLNNRAYLRYLQKSPPGRLMARKRGIIPKRDVPSRQPHHFQRGNHLALTHGLYAGYLPEFEELAGHGIRLSPLDIDVLRWRIVVRRAGILLKGARTLSEAVPLLRAAGIASLRVARALKRRREILDVARELDLQAELLDGWGDDDSG